jgi:hypothetical protein
LVHPLISCAVRTLRPDLVRRQQLRQGAAAVLANLLDERWTGHSPAALAVYLPHVHAIAAAAENVDEWHLLNEAGSVHSELGDSAEALLLYRTLYDRCQARLGDTDPATVAMLVGLGVSYGLHVDHATAGQLKQQAVEVLTSLVGRDHSDTMVAWNNLAVTCSDGGDHERAMEIFDDVYHKRLAALGPGHVDTVEALMNYSIAAGRCGHDDLAA